VKAGEPLAELDRVLERSQLMLATAAKPAVLDDKGDLDYRHGLEHWARFRWLCHEGVQVRIASSPCAPSRFPIVKWRSGGLRPRLCGNSP